MLQGKITANDHSWILLKQFFLFDSTASTADLLSGPMNPIAPESCLRFYYNMFGVDVETLNVYVQQEEDKNNRTLVFTQSHSQANVWRYAQASIKVTGVHQVSQKKY